jgi:hypothetical protein
MVDGRFDRNCQVLFRQRQTVLIRAVFVRVQGKGNVLSTTLLVRVVEITSVATGKKLCFQDRI